MASLEISSPLAHSVLSSASRPPCTMPNKFCLSGLLWAFIQRSSQRTDLDKTQVTQTLQHHCKNSSVCITFIGGQLSTIICHLSVSVLTLIKCTRTNVYLSQNVQSLKKCKQFCCRIFSIFSSVKCEKTAKKPEPTE